MKISDLKEAKQKRILADTELIDVYTIVELILEKYKSYGISAGGYGLTNEFIFYRDEYLESQENSLLQLVIPYKDFFQDKPYVSMIFLSSVPFYSRDTEDSYAIKIKNFADFDKFLKKDFKVLLTNIIREHDHYRNFMKKLREEISKIENVRLKQNLSARKKFIFTDIIYGYESEKDTMTYSVDSTFSNLRINHKNVSYHADDPDDVQQLLNLIKHQAEVNNVDFN